MKAKIVIASTLKPVIDPRAYEKIGKSLAQTDEYDIHIIGSLPTAEEKVSNISLYPLASNVKQSLSRLFLPWKVLRQIQNLKPDLIIIGTHELLIIGLVYKLLHNTKLVYDVRENYYYNLVYQNNYPWPVKYLLAVYVRLKEIIIASFIDQFILAERCYVDELSFIKKRFTVIENKFKARDNLIVKPVQSIPKLLLSGTISEPYGVFDAITFYKALPAGKFKLVIVGHCPNRKTLGKLMKEVEGDENIDLDVSSQPISQARIDAKIGDQTIGILPYKENESIRNKIPTKLYEYIGLGIPVLISPNPVWEKLLHKYEGGRSTDFLDSSNIVVLDVINTLNNSRQQSDLMDVMWNSEEDKLLDLVDALITTK